LKLIAALYQIEKDIRGLTAEERLATRKEQSAPLIATFETWLNYFTAAGECRKLKAGRSSELLAHLSGHEL